MGLFLAQVEVAGEALIAAEVVVVGEEVGEAGLMSETRIVDLNLSRVVLLPTDSQRQRQLLNINLLATVNPLTSHISLFMACPSLSPGTNNTHRSKANILRAQYQHNFLSSFHFNKLLLSQARSNPFPQVHISILFSWLLCNNSNSNNNSSNNLNNNSNNLNNSSNNPSKLQYSHSSQIRP